MKSPLKISIFSGIGVILALTAFYVYKQSKLIQSLCYEFVTMNYSPSGDGKANINARVRFINYADVPIDITSYKVDALIDNSVVAKISSNQNYTIPAKGTTAIDFVANTNTGNAINQLITTVLEELIDKKQSYFQLKGAATVKMGWVKVKNYPIDLKWTSQEVITNIKGQGEKCPKIT